MEAGTVLHWPDFEFKDGNLDDKYCVLLSDASELVAPHIFCKVTSQRKNKPDSQGCISRQSLFMIPAGKECLKKDSWLQFYDLYEFYWKDLLSSKFKKNVQNVGKLSELCMKQIKNCLKQCPDVEKRFLDIVLGKTPQVPSIKPRVS